MEQVSKCDPSAGFSQRALFAQSFTGRLYFLLILGALRELVSWCLGLESGEDLGLREPQ